MRKKLWITSLLAALSITTAGVAIAKQDAKVTDAVENWTVGTIDNKYVYGTSFEVPDATVEINGESVAATATITYPNGVTVSGDNVMLNQSGVYTVTYRAQVGGIHCVEEKTFTVENNAYLMQSEESSAVYGYYDGFGSNSYGLKVRLAPNDKLAFSQVVDMSAITSETQLLEAFITPDAYGTYDFTKLIFRFTDALDSSKYLQIRINKYTAEDRGLNWAYADVTFADQPTIGCESGKYKYNTSTGTPFTMTFSAAMAKGNQWYGEMVQRAPDAGTAKVMYNPISEEIKVSNAHVANLNNPELFEKVWEGFPSGKAKITVEAQGIVNSTANFCIKSIYGIDLQSAYTIDNEAPIITTAISEENMPKGEVNTAYTIPAATALDFYAGNCNVKTNVYRDYASNSPISVDVADGKFMPTVAGWHTIVYTAIDAMGNEAKTLRNVFVENDLGEIVVTAADVSKNVTLGSWVSIPEISYTGDCGIATVETKVFFGDEEIALADGKFLPEKAGEWKITYVVTDYIGRVGTCDFVITAEPGEGYVILEKLVLPRVYISDCQYDLPELYATDYAKGYAEKILCDVVVTDKNGTKTYKAGDKFTPSVETNGDKITIVYTCGETTLVEKKIPTVVVRNDAKKQVIGMNYIYGEDVDTSYKYTVLDKNGNVVYEEDGVTPKTEWYSAGVEIKANKSGESIGWTFATPQLMNNFSLVLEGLEAYTKFEALKITLADSINENETISILLNKKGANTGVVIGDDSYDVLDTSIEMNEQYRLYYADKKVTFGGIVMPVETTVDGEEFNGFSSNLAYVTVEMINAEEGAAYVLRSINESNLSRRNNEVFAPNFQILGEASGNAKINSLYTTNLAIANDVFAPSTSLSMTVIAPDGTIAVDQNGLTLQDVPTDVVYTFEMTQYGKYEIKYTVVEVDWVTSNPLSVSNYTYVVDEQKPQVVFTNATQTTAKVGDTITLPTFVFKDNVTTNENMMVVTGFYNPHGQYVRFKDNENAVKCAYAGKYKFIVMVFDEGGNMTAITHTVMVTE